MVHVSKQKQSTGSGRGVWVLLLVVLAVVALSARVFDVPVWLAIFVVLLIPCLIWAGRAWIKHRAKSAVAEA